MVAHDDNRGVFVEILRLNPLHKVRHLTTGAGDRLVIGLAAVAFFTQCALIAAHVVGIHGQHGKGKGFGIFRKGSDLLLRVLKKVQIFHAPPDKIIAGDDAVGTGGVDVADLVDAVLREIDFSTAEAGIGADHQGLVISGVVQNVGQGGDSGQESLAGSAILIHVFRGRFQGDAGSLSDHGADGPCGTLGGIETADFFLRIGKTEIFAGQIVKFRNQVFLHGTAQFLGQIGSFHGFQHDVNQIALFFGKGDFGHIGVGISCLVDAAVRVLMEHIRNQFYVKGCKNGHAQR